MKKILCLIFCIFFFSDSVWAEEYNKQYSKYQRISREDADRYRVRNQPNNFFVGSKNGYYVGLDLLYNKYNYDSMYLEPVFNGNHIRFDTYLFKDKLYVLKAVVGYRYNNYLSAEFFVQQSDEVDNSRNYGVTPIAEANTNLKFSYRALGLDFLGYYTINKYYELIGALGLGWYDFNVSANLNLYNKTVGISHSISADMGKKTTYGIRIGAGFQWYLNDNISTVLMGRYVKMTRDDVLKDMLEFSLGLRYNFY